MVLALVIFGICLMWIYGLFFASKEVVNLVGDEQWQQKSENLCHSATLERESLIDLRVVDE